MLKIFKRHNFFWVFVISLDLTIFKMFILEYKTYPFLIEPPLLYLYILIGIGLLVLINKMAYDNRKFKYFIKDMIIVGK